MDVDTGQFAALTEQAADLTARVERLEDHGLALRALLEAVLEESLGRPGSGAGVRGGLKAIRSRHLMAIQGSGQ